MLGGRPSKVVGFAFMPEKPTKKGFIRQKNRQAPDETEFSGEHDVYFTGSCLQDRITFTVFALL